MLKLKPRIEIVEWSDVNKILSDADVRSKIIVAPNFEERSRFIAEACCASRAAQHSRASWTIITLQGKNPHEIMDIVKARNANRVMSVLDAASSGVEIQHTELQYPSSFQTVRHSLKGLLQQDLRESVLVLDISAIPRNLLWSILRVLADAGELSSGFPPPRETYLVYAWAADYPNTAAAEIVGDIIGNTLTEPIPLLVKDATSVDALVCTSGNTQDAFRTIDVIRGESRKRDVTIELVHFIRPRGFRRSMYHIRMHQDLLRRGRSQDRISNNYVFDVEHALAYFRDAAHKSLAKLRENTNHRLLIAPFGPKVLSVIAQFVAQEYVDAIRGDTATRTKLTKADVSPEQCVEVLNSSGTQYLSLYSLGQAGDVSAIRLTEPLKDSVIS